MNIVKHTITATCKHLEAKNQKGEFEFNLLVEGLNCDIKETFKGYARQFVTPCGEHLGVSQIGETIENAWPFNISRSITPEAAKFYAELRKFVTDNNCFDPFIYSSKGWGVPNAKIIEPIDLFTALKLSRPYITEEIELNIIKNYIHNKTWYLKS